MNKTKEPEPAKETAEAKAAEDKTTPQGETGGEPEQAGKSTKSEPAKPETTAKPKNRKTEPAGAKPEPPKSAATEPAKPRAVVAGGIAFLALVVALGAGAGGYWLWQQLQALQAQTEAMGADVVVASQELASRLEGVENQAIQRMNDLARQQEALGNELQSLYTRLGRDSRDWMLAEAEYLIRLANYRLELVRDVTTATAALKAADQRLRQIGDPALLPVRQTLAREIAALEAVDTPDIAGMVLTLRGLEERVDELPLQARYQPTEPTVQQAEVQEQPEVEDWRGFLRAVWENLKSLVVIRYNEKPVEPLLPPEQIQNLNTNLALKFQTARLALLQQDPAVYTATLETIQDWLKVYYDSDAQAVQSTLATLQRLQKTAIKPPLPDITASLRDLRQAAARITETPPAAEAAQ